jgi:hypothetical protein
MKKIVSEYKKQKQEEKTKFTGHLLPKEFIAQERLDNLEIIEEFTKMYFKNNRKEY